MRRKQIDEEFKRINYELRVNRPNFTPYPPDVVKRREMLLFAQVHLSNVLEAKLKKDKWEENFEENMYKVVMSKYYGWDKNE
jgi:hypothetical protein